MAKENEADDVTASLIAGLGKYLKEYRESAGLKQKEFAAMLDLGETRMKHYESGSPDTVGASGFPIALVSKIAEVKDMSVVEVFKDIVRKSPLSFKDLSLADKLDLLMDSETKKGFEKIIKKGDDKEIERVSWALKFAARVLQLKEPARVEIEIEVLKASLGNASFSKEDKERITFLLQRRLELDLESTSKPKG